MTRPNADSRTGLLAQAQPAGTSAFDVLDVLRELAKALDAAVAAAVMLGAGGYRWIRRQQG